MQPQMRSPMLFAHLVSSLLVSREFSPRKLWRDSSPSVSLKLKKNYVMEPRVYGQHLRTLPYPLTLLYTGVSPADCQRMFIDVISRYDHLTRLFWTWGNNSESSFVIGIGLYMTYENDSFSNIKMTSSAYSRCSWIRLRANGVTLGPVGWSVERYILWLGFILWPDISWMTPSGMIKVCQLTSLGFPLWVRLTSCVRFPGQPWLVMGKGVWRWRCINRLARFVF